MLNFANKENFQTVNNLLEGFFYISDLQVILLDKDSKNQGKLTLNFEFLESQDPGSSAKTNIP